MPVAKKPTSAKKKTDEVINKIKAEPKEAPKRKSRSKTKFMIDLSALKKLKLVAVAFSHVEREMFPTDDAYEAEIEVEDRAQEVIDELKKLGVEARGYRGDQYLLTNLLVDKPDLVINLVDTLRGKDSLQVSVPAALELSNIPYTGAGMEGMVIGNNRNLTKRLLLAYDVPTPAFQFIRRAGTAIDPELGTPLIVKLNEGGGSVGIDNKAVQETLNDAQKKVDTMLNMYHLPVIVEEFIDGAEVTVSVYDDGVRRHVYMGEKIFRKKPDGKHFFTSHESYDDLYAYKYKPVEDEALRGKIERLAARAFSGLHFKDYAKFDVRVDDKTGIPYFTDANPNTAFGPDLGLPFTEVLAMHNVPFEKVLASMLSKYGRQLS